MPGRKKQNGGLLADYVSNYGSAMRTRKSLVALRAAKIEAELTYKARGEFLANMNHELRTPLNAIMGFASLMKEMPAGQMSDETRAEYLEYILQSSELLLGHLNTILELAAAESGGAKNVRRASAPSEILVQAADANRALCEAVGVTIHSRCQDGLPEVMVDPDRISTAVNRLIETAISDCQEGCTITLSAQTGRRKDGIPWVYFEISDDGAGMTPEELNRSLRAFEEVRQGLHRQGTGTGLGLPIAKSFIELNGGKFAVTSRKGQGTRVRFALPGIDVGEEDAPDIDTGEDGTIARILKMAG